MSFTVGIDVGSTYTKALVLSKDRRIVGRAMELTGFQLGEVAERSQQVSEEVDSTAAA